MVTAIGKGSIRVRDENGNIYVLYLGACSSLSADELDFLPQKGDLIEW